VKVGGYIHIFRAKVLPPTSPSHNTCLSETLVSVLTRETRGYSEKLVPSSQRTGRHIPEDEQSCQRYCFECSMEQGVWSLVMFQAYKFRRGRLKRDRRNRSKSVYV